MPTKKAVSKKSQIRKLSARSPKTLLATKVSTRTMLLVALGMVIVGGAAFGLVSSNLINKLKTTNQITTNIVTNSGRPIDVSVNKPMTCDVNKDGKITKADSDEIWRYSKGNDASPLNGKIAYDSDISKYNPAYVATSKYAKNPIKTTDIYNYYLTVADVVNGDGKLTPDGKLTVDDSQYCWMIAEDNPNRISTGATSGNSTGYTNPCDIDSNGTVNNSDITEIKKALDPIVTSSCKTKWYGQKSCSSWSAPNTAQINKVLSFVDVVKVGGAIGSDGQITNDDVLACIQISTDNKNIKACDAIAPFGTINQSDLDAMKPFLQNYEKLPAEYQKYNGLAFKYFTRWADIANNNGKSGLTFNQDMYNKCANKLYDLNSDGKIDHNDYNIIQYCSSNKCDLNNDGKIDANDMGIVKYHVTD